MQQKTYYQDGTNYPPPHPLSVIVCECGCDIVFQPNRKDQIYLNKQHADFAYNHGKRKEKHVNQLKVEKILRLNDRVLQKFFQLNKKDSIMCYLNNLKADGFKSEYFIGQDKKDEQTIYYSYNYTYQIGSKDGQKLIKINKR